MGSLSTIQLWSFIAIFESSCNQYCVNLVLDPTSKVPPGQVKPRGCLKGYYYPYLLIPEDQRGQEFPMIMAPYQG